jgi:hypothetical protein
MQAMRGHHVMRLVLKVWRREAATLRKGINRDRAVLAVQYEFVRVLMQGSLLGSLHAWQAHCSRADHIAQLDIDARQFVRTALLTRGARRWATKVRFARDVRRRLLRVAAHLFSGTTRQGCWVRWVECSETQRRMRAVASKTLGCLEALRLQMKALAWEKMLDYCHFLRVVTNMMRTWGLAAAAKGFRSWLAGCDERRGARRLFSQSERLRLICAMRTLHAATEAARRQSQHGMVVARMMRRLLSDTHAAFAQWADAYREGISTNTQDFLSRSIFRGMLLRRSLRRLFDHARAALRARQAHDHRQRAVFNRVRQLWSPSGDWQLRALAQRWHTLHGAYKTGLQLAAAVREVRAPACEPPAARADPARMEEVRRRAARRLWSAGRRGHRVR